MATRLLRDPTLLRELDATAETFRDLCDDRSAQEAAEALQAILTTQSEREQLERQTYWISVRTACGAGTVSARYPTRLREPLPIPRTDGADESRATW